MIRDWNMSLGINKKHLIKKLVTSYFVFLLLISLFSMVFIVACDNVKGKEKLFPMLDDGSSSTDSTTTDSTSSTPSDSTTSDTSSTDTSTTDTTSDTDSGKTDTGTTDTSTSDSSTKDDEKVLKEETKDTEKVLKEETKDTEKVLKKETKDTEKVLKKETKDTEKNNDSAFWNWMMNLSDDDSDYAPNERIVPAEEIVAMIEKELGNFSDGEETGSELENSDEISMCRVKFVSTTNLKKVKVKVVKLKDKPAEIIEIPKENITVHNYLDIKLTAEEEFVEEGQVKSLKFKFKVELSWIAENNIDKITVLLMRYHYGKWQNLSTTLQSEDETYVYYEAETPGCSTFAVIGSKVIEIDESYAAGGIDIPWPVLFGFTVFSFFVLAVVVFKGRIIYIDKSEKEN